jgi:hypothetical protein
VGNRFPRPPKISIKPKLPSPHFASQFCVPPSSFIPSQRGKPGKFRRGGLSSAFHHQLAISPLSKRYAPQKNQLPFWQDKEIIQKFFKPILSY